VRVQGRLRRKGQNIEEEQVASNKHHKLSARTVHEVLEGNAAPVVPHCVLERLPVACSRCKQRREPPPCQPELQRHWQAARRSASSTETGAESARSHRRLQLASSFEENALPVDPCGFTTNVAKPDVAHSCENKCKQSKAGKCEPESRIGRMEKRCNADKKEGSHLRVPAVAPVVEPGALGAAVNQLSHGVLTNTHKHDKFR
jgi:hypothetical protein